MEIRLGVCSCFVIFATFLSLATLPQSAQAQRSRGSALRLVTQPDPVYYVSKRVPANITCEALAATSIIFVCVDQRIPPSSQRTFETYDEGLGQNRMRSSIQVNRSDIYDHQRGGNRDDFWCECIAEDRAAGARERSRRAIFRLAYMRKRFQEEPSSQTVQIGGRAVFRCVAPDGEPTPEIIWRKDGRRISSDRDRDDNFVIGADNSLTVVSVRQQDAGDYECVAKNDAFRRTSKSATLTVEDRVEGPEVPGEETTTAQAGDYQEGDEPVFLEKPPTVIYVGPEKPFPVVCDTQGFDQMTLQCNRQRVTQDKLSMSEDRAKKRVRIVYNLTYAEVENYLNRFNEEAYRCECVAWFRTEEAERGWKAVSTNSSQVYLATLEEDFEEEPPRDFTVQLGTTATLPCKPPMGKPSPWVYWMFNSDRLDLRSNPRYRMEGDGSLVIQQVQDSDEGQYYCVAENLAGYRESRMAYLAVSAEPVPVPEETSTLEPTFPALIPTSPVFTQDLQAEYFLNERGEANLECSVIGADQLTYRCTKGRLEAGDQKIKQRISPDGQARMLTALTTVTYEEVLNFKADNYTCQCVAWYRRNNDWDTAMGNAAIIRIPYLDGEFLYEPKGGLFAVGDTAELACTPPNGAPKPKIYWLKDGYPLRADAEGSNLLMLDEGILVIEPVTMMDAGQYICYVNNSAGERSSIPVMVEVFELPETTTTTTPPPPPTTTTTDELSSTTSPSSTLFTTTPYYPGEGETTQVVMNGRQPIFTMMPEEEVFILRSQPAVLRCGAMQVSALRFYCNGERVYAEDEDPGQSVDPTPGLTFLEKSIEVTREQVANFAGSEPYTCQCRAYFESEEGEEGDQDYLATDSIIEVAYMRKKFEQSPEAKFVGAGERTELVCRPPKGVPEPMVHWLKDGFRLENSDTVHGTREGSLIFESIEPSDAGEYTCVAKNAITTRYSDTIPVEVTSVITEMTSTTDSSDVIDLTTSATPEPEGEVGQPEGEDDHEGHPEPEGEGYPETTPEGEDGAKPEDGLGPSGNEVEVLKPEDGSEEPVFLAEPESMYYIIKSRPVTIFCQTKGAQRITFDCNGNNIPQSLVHYQNNIVEGEEDVLMASIDVSREAVENFHNNQEEGEEEDFYCQCHAQYSLPGLAQPQLMPSSKGYVEVAYLRKMFRRQPDNLTVEAGQFVSLHCEAPDGNPVPEIKWMKDAEEVFGDLSAPDGALIFQSVGPSDAGIYYCVASNLANMRTSDPAAIVVSGHMGIVTAAPVQEGSPEPEGGDNELSRCVDILKVCSAYMPQSQPDQGTSCHTLPLYKGCYDDFMEQCADALDDESLQSALQAKAMVDTFCQGVNVCPELMECHAEYKRTSMPDLSAETLPTDQLCAGIESFLRCADDAMRMCNMSRGNRATSLVDVATWFQQYCDRVSGRDWEDQCDSLSACEMPTQQAVVLPNMVEVSKWCPQIYDTLSCTTRMVENCGMDREVEGDIELLTDLASITCPEHEGDDAKGDDDMGDDGKEDDDDDDDMGEGKGGEPGQSLGHDDGDGSGASDARVSILLMSLLSLLFVVAGCR